MLGCHCAEERIVLTIKCFHSFLFERGADASTRPNSAAPGFPGEWDRFVEHKHRAKSTVILRPLGNERNVPRPVTSRPFRIELPHELLRGSGDRILSRQPAEV